MAQSLPAGLRILARDSTRTLPTVALNNQEYVAADDLAQAFGVTTREDQLVGGLTITAGGRTIVVTADQPIVSVAGRLVSLPTAPIRQGGRWLLPLEFLPRALGPALETRLDLRRGTRLLVVGDLRVPRVTARVEPGAGGTSVTFEATPPTPSRLSLDAGRLVVTYEADALDLTLPSVGAQDFLQSLQAGDTPTTIRMATGPKFGMHRATTSQPNADTSRLVVELLPAGAAAPAPPAPVPAPDPVDPGPLPMPMPAPGVRIAVIDPGHGGEETGARGPAGTEEKDVTLSVARRLRTLIESRLGLRVFLTRDDDRTMSLDERSAYANSQKADLFISIHANAGVPGLRGAEVYYLTLDLATDARGGGEGTAVVLPTLGGGARTIDLIPWDTAQARYLDQSASFAGMVESALRARVEMSARPLQQAPFRVLVGANMPAVLVEIGYLSNANQEEALRSGGYQDQIAQALFNAIAQYRAQVEGTLAPAAGGQPPS